MSKHKGNVVDPLTVLEKHGADATRWHFYTASAPWLPTRFGEDDVIESQRKFLSTFWNVYTFYVLYAEIDNFDPIKYSGFASNNIMDRWIISKLNSLVFSTDEHLKNYRITQAALSIENFTDELSNWYVRSNRTRFWSGKLTDDKIGAYMTLYSVLVTLCKITCPFVPFITEEIYQNLVTNLNSKAKKSVHLCSWPEYYHEEIDNNLEETMDIVIQIVKLGRSARNNAKIKNRQPISNMLVNTSLLPKSYIDIIKDELNIKNIEFNSDLSKYVLYEIKPNLPILGKVYGKLIPLIKKEIASRNQTELAQEIQNGNNVNITVNNTDVVLNNKNLIITMQGIEGFAFSGEKTLGVVLDTHITENLKEEGYLREIISKIQNMRKDFHLDITDKIKLYIDYNNVLEKIIKKFEDEIKMETLTLEIFYNENKSYTEININDEKLNITIEVVK